MKKLIGFICAVVGLSTCAFSADYTWTGGGGDSSWTNSANWGKAEGYPSTSADRAIVPVLSAAYTVELDTGAVTPLRGVIATTGADVTLTAGAGSSINFCGSVSSQYDGLNANGGKLTFNIPAAGTTQFDIWITNNGEIHVRSEVGTTYSGNGFIGGGTGTVVFEGDAFYNCPKEQMLTGGGDNPGDTMARIILRDNAKFTCAGCLLAYGDSCANQEVVLEGDNCAFTTGWIDFSYSQTPVKDDPRYRDHVSALFVNAGTLTTKGMTIGNNRKGRFEQTGGSVVSSGNISLAKGTGNADYAFVLTGGTFENAAGFSVSGAIAGKVEIGGTATYIAKNGSASSVPVAFSGTPTFKSLKKDYTATFPEMTFAKDTVLTVVGPGNIGPQSSFAPYGTINLTSGANFICANYEQILRPDGATEPWKLNIGANSYFKVCYPDSVTGYLPDITIEDGGYIHGYSRATVFAHSVTVAGVAQAKGLYPGAATGWIRDANGCLGIPEVWTGAGDGTNWNDAANWESGVVPANGNTTCLDLTAATEVTVDSAVTAGILCCFKTGADKTLTFKGEGSVQLGRGGSYQGALYAYRDNTVDFYCTLKRDNAARIWVAKEVVARKNVFQGWGSSFNMCLAGDYVLRGNPLDTTTYGGDGLLMTMAGGSYPVRVVIDEGTVLSMPNLYFSPSGYGWTWQWLQRKDSTMTFTGTMFLSTSSTSSKWPKGYEMEGGTLNVKNLRLGYWTGYVRYPGVIFLMHDGTVNAELVSSEQNGNYYYLNGGTFVVGAGGIVQTFTSFDTPSGSKFVKNTEPSLQLGGVTLKASADFTVTLPTLLSGKGGDATIDTDGYTITFTDQAPITGSAALTKTGDGTLVFAGTNGFTGALNVTGGAVRFAEGLEQTAAPAMVKLADASMLTVDAGVTVDVDELVVNGVRQPAGEQTFGAGTVNVLANGGNFWTGAKGNGLWFDAGNWNAGQVPNGALATVDLSISPLGEDETITLGENLVLNGLTYDRVGGGTLTLTGEAGIALNTSTNSTIRVAPGCTLVLDVDYKLGVDPTYEANSTILFTGGGTVVFNRTCHNNKDSSNINSHWTFGASEGTKVVFKGEQKGGNFSIMTGDQSNGVTEMVVDGGATVTQASVFPTLNGNWLANVAGAVTVNEGGKLVCNNLTKFGSSSTISTYLTMNGGELSFTDGSITDATLAGGATTHIALNGGTLSQGRSGCVFSSYLSDITLGGRFTIAPAEGCISYVGSDFVKGAGELVAGGAGGVVSFEGSVAAATNLAVTAGAMVLNDVAAASVREGTTLEMRRGTELGLDFDGTLEVESLTVNGRPRKAGTYTAANPPSGVTLAGDGTLKVKTGEAAGLVIIVK